ncbi:long-chain acyl-CoA synthetase [Saccharopolyspora erythraea NRRL 2338]|uniref:AMP-dependent Acyl-CoA synthetase and ligase n=2 Tax=Saccharopolyspora erythraea TaxID=1836 RepID=A4FF59_SACEN|nr:long-chain fatty acid--CoA ligase [Saccharopolyspora erythraea]EQD86040.1 acyl-CoA synthetase [Saccharopolyspora erythraea D]PFG96408.1 long-chain acyl-CoA synthetase [Saccharopolyspora erythraea NRRL 2338]QRK92911.1 long-chain fatty acid--CoA ligase [Saccharopolyspora erythraea]CAM02684.1 AMP-dependent Acyl-CoA synthetase and ligase [Saccharopolyspora erythraea NRRL 2338]
MSVYDERPWLARYDAGQPHDIEPEFANALEMFAASVRAAPDRPAVKYFDGVLSRSELDELSDAFACGLLDRGIRRGDRVALFLQNVPQFLVALLGTWKAGCVAVAINPMNKQRELSLLLRDSGARALVCLESLHGPVAGPVLGETDVELVMTTSELEHQSRDDPRVLGDVRRIRCEGAEDMSALIERFRGRRPPAVELGPDDVAVLTYTSGTTGPPKGAMNTHRNLVFNARAVRDWVGIGESDVVFGVAPLFHITGMVAHAALALLTTAPLVLFCRFEPNAAVDLIREHRPTFTIGSITVFIALMNAPEATSADLSSLTRVYSGGAPIPPSTTRAFQERFGHYIHNIYGLTETTAPTHAVPLHGEAPVDPESGALSIGVPMYSTVARIVGDDGADLPAGRIGEVVVRGPQVVAGYWNKPEETAGALPGGWLHTGDVGYMDHVGWFYLVDRKKDQINTGGYKVWPREVEDVLYEHEAVREAAVVGVPDEYRGEMVKGFVSLRPGLTASPEELVDFCRRRMAAYKYPRQVEVLEELPKTATGKLLRRQLRAR